jgi:hypothetical protein
MRTSRSTSGAVPGTRAGETAGVRGLLAPPLRRAGCYKRLDIWLWNLPSWVAVAPSPRVRDAADPTSGRSDSRMYAGTAIFSAHSLLLPRRGSSSEELRCSAPFRDWIAP